MKMKLMTVLLASIMMPLCAHAELTPPKQSYCQRVPKGSVGQCFHNQTGKVFTGKTFQMVEEDYFVNGSSSQYKYPLDGFSPGDFINVTMPTKLFNSKRVAMMDFTLIKDGKPLPGCKVKLSPTIHPKLPVLAIKEKNGRLHC